MAAPHRELVIAAAAWVAIILAGAARAHEAQPARRTCVPGTAEVSVLEFGAKGDASGDNVEAFRDALDYVSRCAVPTLRIPKGRYRFAVSAPANGLTLGSNVALLGAGVGETVLEIVSERPGANFASLFWARNQDNISIRGMSFIGSSERVPGPDGQPLLTYGSALTIAIDARRISTETGEPRPLSHFLIQDDSFENFDGAAWISVIDYSASFSIDDVRIIGNRFTSRPGNAIGGHLMTHSSAAISIMGSLTSANGLVTDVAISDNTIEARYIKGGVNIWSGVRGARVERNRILDAGTGPDIADDAGAYAVNVYSNAYYHDAGHAPGELMGGIRPDMVRIEHNVISNPRSCGVYAAGADHLWVVSNEFSGQTDALNGTLPKGAVALNQPLHAVVTDNHIRFSRIGMDLYEGANGRISESNNQIDDVPANGVDVFRRRPSR